MNDARALWPIPFVCAYLFAPIRWLAPPAPRKLNMTASSAPRSHSSAQRSDRRAPSPHSEDCAPRTTPRALHSSSADRRRPASHRRRRFGSPPAAARGTCSPAQPHRVAAEHSQPVATTTAAATATTARNALAHRCMLRVAFIAARGVSRVASSPLRVCLVRVARRRATRRLQPQRSTACRRRGCVIRAVVRRCDQRPPAHSWPDADGARAACTSRVKLRAGRRWEAGGTARRVAA